MTITVSQIREELADREAIRDCLFRYARGVDRLDEAMIRSAYWPDATDHHLEFNGTPDEFIAWSMPIMRHMEQTMHMFGNILIRLHGDTASVEAYYYGFHRVPNGAGGWRDAIGSGRYLDLFERRHDEWRIKTRKVMVDWFRDYPDSADWEAGPFGMKIKPGGRYPDDDSYTMLKLG